MRVHRHECRSCRENVDLLRRSTEFESCPFCEDGKLEWQATVGVVYSSGNDIRPGVRELVEEWNDRVEENPHYEQSDVPVLLGKLEELIEHE